MLMCIVDLMVDALDKINHTLEIEPVVKYINNYKKHKGVDIKDRKREYFPGFEHAERILKKIASSKISKENEKTYLFIGSYIAGQCSIVCTDLLAKRHCIQSEE